MKRTALIAVALTLSASLALAQAPATQGTQPAQTKTPSQTATPGQAQPGAAGQQQPGAAGQTQAAPAAPKGAPQAKTQEEFKAYQSAIQLQQQGGQDLASAEAAADQFNTQYPDSELRGLLYQNLMGLYQQQNNADKTVEVGRKLLTVSPDNPVALVMVATVLAERTRDSDLDKDERLNEAVKDAQRALDTVDQMALPASVPADRAAAAKSTLRSMAYSAIGSAEATRENYPVAEQNLRKSIEQPNVPPDSLTLLRLALMLDKQKKYVDALPFANKAVDAAQDASVRTLASQERDRLVKLTGSGAATPATGAAPAQNPASTTPAPAATKPTSPATPPHI